MWLSYPRTQQPLYGKCPQICDFFSRMASLSLTSICVLKQTRQYFIRRTFDEQSVESAEKPALGQFSSKNKTQFCKLTKIANFAAKKKRFCQNLAKKQNCKFCNKKGPILPKFCKKTKTANFAAKYAQFCQNFARN